MEELTNFINYIPDEVNYIEQTITNNFAGTGTGTGTGTGIGTGTLPSTQINPIVYQKIDTNFKKINQEVPKLEPYNAQDYQAHLFTSYLVSSIKNFITLPRVVITNSSIISDQITINLLGQLDNLFNYIDQSGNVLSNATAVISEFNLPIVPLIVPCANISNIPIDNAYLTNLLDVVKTYFNNKPIETLTNWTNANNMLIISNEIYSILVNDHLAIFDGTTNQKNMLYWLFKLSVRYYKFIPTVPSKPFGLLVNSYVLQTSDRVSKEIMLKNMDPIPNVLVLRIPLIVPFTNKKSAFLDIDTVNPNITTEQFAQPNNLTTPLSNFQLTPGSIMKWSNQQSKYIDANPVLYKYNKYLCIHIDGLTDDNTDSLIYPQPTITLLFNYPEFFIPIGSVRRYANSKYIKTFWFY